MSRRESEILEVETGIIGPEKETLEEYEARTLMEKRLALLTEGAAAEGDITPWDYDAEKRKTRIRTSSIGSSDSEDDRKPSRKTEKELKGPTEAMTGVAAPTSGGSGGDSVTLNIPPQVHYRSVGTIKSKSLFDQIIAQLGTSNDLEISDLIHGKRQSLYFDNGYECALALALLEHGHLESFLELVKPIDRDAPSPDRSGPLGLDPSPSASSGFDSPHFNYMQPDAYLKLAQHPEIYQGPHAMEVVSALADGYRASQMSYLKSDPRSKVYRASAFDDEGFNKDKAERMVNRYQETFLRYLTARCLQHGSNPKVLLPILACVGKDLKDMDVGFYKHSDKNRLHYTGEVFAYTLGSSDFTSGLDNPVWKVSAQERAHDLNKTDFLKIMLSPTFEDPGKNKVILAEIIKRERAAALARSGKPSTKDDGAGTETPSREATGLNCKLRKSILERDVATTTQILLANRDAANDFHPEYGATSFMLAIAWARNPEMIKCIANTGAVDFTIKDSDGKDAIDLALKSKDPEIVEAVLSCAPDISRAQIETIITFRGADPEKWNASLAEVSNIQTRNGASREDEDLDEFFSRPTRSKPAPSDTAKTEGAAAAASKEILTSPTPHFLKVSLRPRGGNRAERRMTPAAPATTLQSSSHRPLAEETMRGRE